jgi:hypothetical protein
LKILSQYGKKIIGLRKRSFSDRFSEVRIEVQRMKNFLLWLILLVICWPLALLALVLYPLVWLLLLPFRLLGIAMGGIFELLAAIITLPARILRGPRA